MLCDVMCAVACVVGACYVFLGEEWRSVRWVGASTAVEGAGIIACAVMEGAVLMGPAVGV